MNVILEDKRIEGERLEFSGKENIFFLGPNLIIERCELVLRVASRWFHIMPTRFIDCSIVVKQELKNSSWTCAALKGCRFKGRMSGCDFGPWQGYTQRWEYGSVEDCDFTEARLSNCRFHGCDMRTVRLPKWPCFTILDPIGRAQELNSIKWPRRFGRVVMEDIHTHPSSTVAMTLFAPTEAERYETTPEEIKSLIEKFDFIVY